MNLIDILNFQPFGDHGVMSLLSIRVVHIILSAFCAYGIWDLYVGLKEERDGDSC